MLKTIKKMFTYFNVLLKKYVFIYFILIFFSVISEILLLIPTYLNGKIIDMVLIKDFQSIIKYLAISLFIYIFSAVLSLFETYLYVFLSQKTLLNFKTMLCEKIVCLKMEEFDKRSSGEYLERLDSDTSTICSFYINTLPNLVINVFKLVGTGILSIYLCPLLALVGILSFPVSLIINLYFGKKMKKVYSKVRESADELTSISQQIVNGEKTIKGLNIENAVLKRYRSKAEDYFKVNLNSGMLSAYGGLVQTIVSTIFELVIIAIASYCIIDDRLSIGSYVSFNVYLSKFLSALRNIASTNLNIQTVIVATDRINKIFSQENESFAHKSYELQELEIYGDIKIGDLEFSYRDNQKILDKINTSFSKNSVTAIVGASGSGKTTMLNLLVRFYESEGNILIDGHNIKSLSINTLRNLVSYIQQDSFFFKDTIKNNLNIVNSNVTDEEIEEACKKAEIYNKIISLPNGFNTLLGENASILSGGEKQRLAIARGLLKKAKVFLFDEVTSNLDGETEKEILKTLLQLGEEYTVIIIAHRVTLVENIPRIIVLDKGRVVGEGNHNYLLGMCKEYQRLFKKRE